MKVRIVRCLSDNKWYYKLHMNEIFEVYDYGDRWYKCIGTGDHVGDYIDKMDAEIVEDTSTESDHGVTELKKIITMFKNMTPEEYQRIYNEVMNKELAHNVPKIRIPDENTARDTLVRIKESEDTDWELAYYAGCSTDIKSQILYCYYEGATSKTSTARGLRQPKLCEIVEETIKEKRKRIFHKFVPEGYKWYAIDANGNAYYYQTKPNKSKDRWVNAGWGGAGFADPYDWENSLISRED